MARWGMTIDLRKCIGCRACTIVCKQTNRVPRNTWRRVIDGEISEYPERQRLFLPMSCMHCSEAPCLEVCPTTATYRRADGIVDVHDDLCIGCGYCIVACPYIARTITTYAEVGPGIDAISQEPEETSPDLDRLGVCTKCNFCLPRVEAGLAQGLTPGLDPEASPACTISCSANALHFGDLDDPNSMVSQLIRENNTTRLQEELGTGPSVYYIVGESSAEAQAGTEIEFVPATLQEAWRWPAIANFFLGGMATGLYLLGFVLTIVQGVMRPDVFKLLAPVLASIGFLSLTIEAGRPMRARYLLRHLGRSWMSRETLAGAVFIPAAILDWLFPHPIVWGVALIGALGLLISQGFMLYRARGVTAWNVPLVPFLFLSSGLVTGGGLMLLAGPDWLALGSIPLVVGLIVVVLDLVIWLLYLHWSKDAAFRGATESLRRAKALTLSVGIGHIFPALLLLILLIPGLEAGAGFGRIVAAIAGLSIIIGGLNQKVGIVKRAGFLRGIGLKKPKEKPDSTRLSKTQPNSHIDPGVIRLSTDFVTGDMPKVGN